MQPYNPEWHDMSDYVVHFTKSTQNHTAYDNMMSILYDRVLHAGNPFGIGRHTAPNIDTQRAVCFSEIPLHLLGRIADRRGEYGIGFTKQFILGRGGGPIWYVEHEGLAEGAIQTIIHRAVVEPNPEANPIWTLTPFIDSAGDYPNGAYRFEWEREWRHVGNLNFAVEDVAFLIIPENLHGVARKFFQVALDANSGPAYFCPYIHARWNRDRVRQTLEQ